MNVLITKDCELKQEHGISHMKFNAGIKIKLPVDLAKHLIYNGYAREVK